MATTPLGAVLRLDMGGLPISAPVSSEPIDELRSSIAGRKEQIAEAEKRRESAIASSEAIRAPLREKQSAAMQAELEATKAPLPTLKEAARPIPPDVRIPLDKLFSMIMVAAFASSAAGKKNYMAAAAGLTGALEGIQKGQKDATATALKQYDQAMKAALSEDQKNLQRYNAIMAQRNKTIQEKMTEAKMYATEIQNEVHRSQLETGRIDRFIQNTNNSVDTMQREIARLQGQAQIAADRAREAREREERTRAFQKEMVAIRGEEKRKGNGEDLGKPPAKEITQANQLRNTLIPELEKALPVMQRLNEEGKWSKFTSALGVDSRSAEYLFRDDPEAIQLIRTLAYFRSKEFETAGKALTVQENKILAPLYQAEFRVYSAVKNAVEQGIKQMKRETLILEESYPYIKKVNEKVKNKGSESSSVASEKPKTDVIKLD